MLDSDRWKGLAERGARLQRLLFASTGTKDPEASDTLYVDAFAASDTINTMPDKTLDAFADHGDPGDPLPADGGDAVQVFDAHREQGIDTDELALRLQKEGAEAFWFAEDPGRGERFVAEGAGLFLDYSKNRIKDETMKLLGELAKESQVAERRDAMFRGEHINVSEDRAVLHVALRMPKDRSLVVDGEDVVKQVHEVLDRMSAFSDRVRSGEWKGHTGKPIRNVINIGNRHRPTRSGSGTGSAAATRWTRQIGLSTMLAIGPEGFRDVLAGFGLERTKHFRTSASRSGESLPVLIRGLLAVWYSELLQGAQTVASPARTSSIMQPLPGLPPAAHDGERRQARDARLDSEVDYETGRDLTGGSRGPTASILSISFFTRERT